MDEEKKDNTQMIITVLKIPILLLVFVIIVTCYILFNQFFPKITDFASSHSEYKTKMESYADKERTLEELKSKSAQEKNSAALNFSDSGKVLFKPLESGLDAETMISSEFNEIITLMTSNAIKTRSIKYTYDPQDDNFVKGDPAKYSVCKLDMEMIADYSHFKNFIQDLYKHEHYLDIAKVEIVPYEKNKSILLINLQLKLYAEKA